MPRANELLRSDRGATLVEYSLLVALVAVVSIGALSALSNSSAAAFEDASGAVSDEDDASGPGPSNPGPSNPGPSNPGPSDPGPSDPGPSDPGPSEDAEEDEAEEAPTVSTSFASSSAHRDGDSHNWTAEAGLLISGADGQPLAGSAAVEVNVIERGQDSSGSPVENVSTRSVYVSIGAGPISDNVRDRNPNTQHDAITSITYQVVSVTSISGGTDVEWDGTSPTITILAP